MGTTSKPKIISIATSLTLAAVALVIIVGGAVLWLSAATIRQDTRELTREKAAILTQVVVDRVARQLDPVAAMGEQVAAMLGDVESAKLDRPSMLRAAIAALPQVSSIVIVDAEINVLRVFGARGQSAVERDNWSDDPEFVELVGRARATDRSFWGPMFVAERSGTTFLNFLVPPNPDDPGGHVIVVSVSTTELSRFLATIEHEMIGSGFILVDRSKVLAHPVLVDTQLPVTDAAPLPNLEGFPDNTMAAIWNGHRMPGLEEQFGNQLEARVVGLPGERVAFLFQEVERFGETPWQIGSYFVLKNLAPEITGTRAFLLTSLLILLAAMALAILAGRLLSRPIGRLAETAQKLRDWDIANIPPVRASPLREINEATNALHGAVDRLKAFEAYVPRPVAKRLLSQAASAPIGSETRAATVMFTDIAGFTSWSEQRDPGEILAFLNEHVAMVTRIVRAEGGVVDKFIGDSVMAFWMDGEREDPHAVRAARAVLKIAEAFDEDCRRLAGTPDRLRIGLHSGDLYCGNIGAAERVHYTVIGDTVNVAQRLEGLAREFAEPDRRTEVVISADTAAGLGEGFDKRPLGEREIRGRLGSMMLYELRAASAETKPTSTAQP